MNRTKIEWADYTWNPVTGCWGPGGTAGEPNRCFYCYAEKVAWRFYKKEFEQTMPKPWAPVVRDPFDPAFHPERLSQPAKVKKPSRIFVCSMGDLFGDWVPKDWINEVIWTAEANFQHTFIFLTKNPKAYEGLGALPRNCWVGATITNQADADERIPDLLRAQASVRFLSVEPMLGPVDIYNLIKPWQRSRDTAHGWHRRESRLHWLIIGAMTGPRAKDHQPAPSWVGALIFQGRAARLPVFLKDNLQWAWPEKVQEWPNR